MVVIRALRRIVSCHGGSLLGYVLLWTGYRRTESKDCLEE
jgi:hypothetical protein